MPKITKERKFRTTTKPLGTSNAIATSNQKNEGRSSATNQCAPVPGVRSNRNRPRQTDTSLSAATTNAASTLMKSTSLVEKATSTTKADGTTSGPKSTTPTTATKGQGRANQTTPESSSQHLQSKGQRKRQAKRDQYMRKERMILSSLQVKHAEEQAKRIDGLDALKEALLATVSNDVTSKATTTMTNVPMSQTSATPQETPTRVTHTSLLQSNRGRKLLLAKELKQMNLVWQHPSYQSDPFETMREHLQNTIQPIPQALSNEKGASKKRVDRRTTKLSTTAAASDNKSLVKRKRKATKVRATRSKHR